MRIKKRKKNISKIKGKARKKSDIRNLAVSDFYDDDEYTRLIPGKKYCVGKNSYKQKRLILCNLKELHSAFKEKHLAVKNCRF